jgi:hypothetical protein
LHELRIDLLFSLGVMRWENATVPMRDPSQLGDTEIDAFEADIFGIHDPDTTDAAQIQEIMDVKYFPADIDEMVIKCTPLTNNGRDGLKRPLEKFERLFNSVFGTWDTEPIDLQLKGPNEKQYHAKPHPVPQSQEARPKAEDWFLTVCCKKSTALNEHHQCLLSQRKIKLSDLLQI